MNERGFGTLSFLVLTPLALTILAVLLSAMILFKLDAQAKHQCRSELLTAQETIAKRLEELLRLNASAQILRSQRNAADQAVRLAAGHPVALTAALAAQRAVIARQTALATRQRWLISDARLRSTMSPSRTLWKLSSSLSSKAKIAHSRTRVGTFPLIAQPQVSLTPSYQPAKEFEAAQTLGLDLEVEIASLFPKWLHRFVDLSELRLKTVCTTTITKGDRRWTAALKPDNW